jgi:hypothetical protein
VTGQPDPEQPAAPGRQGFPPVVYAPTTTTPGEDGTARLEMLQLTDGRVALFVYSAVDRLQTAWGGNAPWVLLSVEHLQRAHEAVPFDLLLLDRLPVRGEQS